MRKRVAAEGSIQLFTTCFINVTWKMLDVCDMVYGETKVNADIERLIEAADVRGCAQIVPELKIRKIVVLQSI